MKINRKLISMWAAAIALFSCGVLIRSTIPPAQAQFSPGQVLNAAALNAALASPTIIGGSINGAPVGGITPSSGAFTTLVVNGVQIKLATATTSAMGGSSLPAGTCASTTVAVGSSTTSMVVATSPQVYPGDALVWKGYVSTPGTVTVKVCSITTATPASSAYNVRVWQ